MNKKILVEVSARHVHLSHEDVEKLFGVGYQLRSKKSLSQPGLFAAEEAIDVAGLKNVRIVGPERPQTQVEISLTDARQLGLQPPLVVSVSEALATGQMPAPVGISGPRDQISRPAVIIAHRHLHINPQEAIELGDLKNGQMVKIVINQAQRRLVFNDVIVRIAENYSLAVHLDTDEGNAAGIIEGAAEGELCI